MTELIVPPYSKTASVFVELIVNFIFRPIRLFNFNTLNHVNNGLSITTSIKLFITYSDHPIYQQYTEWLEQILLLPTNHKYSTLVPFFNLVVLFGQRRAISLLNDYLCRLKSLI